MEKEVKNTGNFLLSDLFLYCIFFSLFSICSRKSVKYLSKNMGFNKVPIKQVKHTKFLGVIFDDRLEWSNHITYINTNIANGVGIICRAKQYFNTSARINLYNAFVLPYLIDCVEMWGNALSIHIQSLVKLRNKLELSLLRVIVQNSYIITQEYFHSKY